MIFPQLVNNKAKDKSQKKKKKLFQFCPKSFAPLTGNGPKFQKFRENRTKKPKMTKKKKECEQQSRKKRIPDPKK